MSESGLSSEERTFGMLAHLSGLIGFAAPFGNLVAPLIIWQLKKDDMPFAAAQAKECLNFQLSLTIYFFIALILCIVLIGIPVLLGLIVADVVLTIMAGMKANEGIAYQYPYTIRFFK